jgi:hypothetical protein
MLALPVRALSAAPLGLYDWGLLFAIVTAVVVLIPCALLEQGVARRVVSPATTLAAAVFVALAAWSLELHIAVARDVLPALVCSN